jgi:tetratricopeptide (TPR) repeat protein
VAADATVALQFIQLHTDPESSHAKVRARLETAISVFEEVDDKAGLARALTMAGMLRFWRGESRVATEELERAARYAREAGDRAQEIQSLQFVLSAALYGPMPVALALEQVADMRRRTEGARRLEVTTLRVGAHLEAMRANFRAARELIAEGRALAAELGLEIALAGVLRTAGDIELLAGNPPAAERTLRAAYEKFELRGDWGHLSSVVPVLADALNAQGRGEEAAPAIELAGQWTLADDIDAQIGERRARANLLAQRGDLIEAERLARSAIELVAQTDSLNDHATVLAGLAEVLILAGKREQAAASLQEALALYERKGNLVMAKRARERLTELQKQVTPDGRTDRGILDG